MTNRREVISLQGSTNGPRLVRRDLFFPLHASPGQWIGDNGGERSIH